MADDFLEAPEVPREPPMFEPGNEEVLTAQADSQTPIYNPTLPGKPLNTVTPRPNPANPQAPSSFASQGTQLNDPRATQNQSPQGAPELGQRNLFPHGGPNEELLGNTSPKQANPANPQQGGPSFLQKAQDRFLGGGKNKASKQEGGQPGGSAVNKAKELTNNAKTLAGAGADLASGNYAGLAKKALQNGPALKDAAKQLAKKAVTGWLSTIPGIGIFFTPYGRVVFVLAACLVLAPIILVIGYLLGQNGIKGDKVAGIRETLDGTTLVAGDYLTQMSPTYVVQKGPYKNQELTFSSTQGGFSEELDAHLVGTTPTSQDGTSLRYAYYYDETTGSKKAFTDEDLKYYVTSRWPYAPVNWNGKTGPVPKGDPSIPTDYAFAGKKIIIYNPLTKKAIVGIAAEYGPGPWTGTLERRSPSTITGSVTTKDNIQRDLWGNNGTDFRLHDPKGYSGLIAGGPVALEHAIGADDRTSIIIGFAKDQTLKPGTLIIPELVAKDSTLNVEGRLEDNGNYTASSGSASLADCKDVATKVTWQGPTSADRKGFLGDGTIIRPTPVTTKGRTVTVMEKVNIDPRICGITKVLLANVHVPLEVSAVVSTHFSHGAGSEHWTGKAIDFGNEAVAPQVMAWINQNESSLKSQGLWPDQLFGPESTTLPYGLMGGNHYHKFVAGHNNHFHIGFK
jgi:hypothetical protein